MIGLGRFGRGGLDAAGPADPQNRSRLAGSFRPERVVAGPDQPRFVGEHHGLNPVPEPQLGKDARHVRLDGRLAEEEPLRDLGVGKAPGDQPQDLGFALGQFAERGGRSPGGGRRTNSSRRRRVMAGLSSVSPAAIARTACTSSAGRTSLSRKPLAPARIAR